MHPMESKNIAAKHVSDKAVKIRQQMDIQKNVERRLSDHIKSVVVCED